MEEIAKLQGLKYLHLNDLGADITDLGMLHLTALTALKGLDLMGVQEGMAAQLSSELTASLTQAPQLDAAPGRPFLLSKNAKVSILAE